MSKSVLCLLLLIAPFMNALHAQNQRIIDSLKAVIRLTRNDVEKCNALHDLAAEYIGTDNERAFELAKRAEVVAAESGDTLCTIVAQRLKGQVLYRLGMAQQAIETFRPLLDNPNLKKHSNEHLAVLNALSICHLIIGQFDLGLSYQFQTMRLAQDISDIHYAAVSLMNIGLTYYKLRNYEKALPLMLRSYQVQDSLNIVSFTAPTNISLCYTYLQNFNDAEKFLQRSLMICGNECSPTARLHINYASGCLLFAKHEYDGAERSFLASLQLSEELKNFRLFLDNICMLAKIYIHRDKLMLARSYLERGERVIAAGAPFNMEKIKIYEQFAEVYLQLRHYDKASLYQGKYIELKDSVYNEVLTANLMRIEAEYLENENQYRIEKQRAVISDNEQTIQRQSMLNVVAGLFSIMTIISTIIFYRNYRLKRDMNIMLERKVKERTAEIELEVSKLMRGLMERDLHTLRLIRVIRETTKSLKGLSNIAAECPHDSDVHVFMSKVNETVDRLEKAIDPCGTEELGLGTYFPVGE